MKDKQRKAPAVIMTAVFLIFVFGFAAAFLVTGDREFSETENRSLAQKPEFSWEAVKSGKFTSGLESYISDQLFAKDRLVTLKTDIDRALGKSFLNRVFLIDEGGLRYIQQYKENRAQIEQNILCLKEFAEGIGIPADLMLIPNASAFYLDKLPAGADCDDQRESIEYVRSLVGDSIGFYPMTAPLSEDPQKYYYRTDHHWTYYGAKAAVESYLGSSIGGELRHAEEGFYGTLYSKAPSVFAKADDFIYADSVQAEQVEWVNEGRISGSILDESFLSRKDKYASFFGGNFGQIRIKTGCPGEKLLVLKDSYANAAMQFLMQHYSEITMIDLRYYHMQEKSVSELCREYGVDRVLMLYNMDFINEDRNFVWLE